VTPHPRVSADPGLRNRSGVGPTVSNWALTQTTPEARSSIPHRAGEMLQMRPDGLNKAISAPHAASSCCSKSVNSRSKSGSWPGSRSNSPHRFQPLWEPAVPTSEAVPDQLTVPSSYPRILASVPDHRGGARVRHSAGSRPFPYGAQRQLQFPGPQTGSGSCLAQVEGRADACTLAGSCRPPHRRTSPARNCCAVF